MTHLREFVTRGRTLVTAPAEEPLSLSLVKDHLRETGDGQDFVIDDLIVTARQWAEKRRWEALITQTWDFTWDRFSGGRELDVPLPPLQSVTSVTYKDSDGVTQTLSADDYVVDATSVPGRIRLSPTASWPSIGDYPAAVTLRAVVGYGSSEDVPYNVKQAMLLAIGHWYANRESVVVGSITTRVPLAAEVLIDQDAARVVL